MDLPRLLAEFLAARSRVELAEARSTACAVLIPLLPVGKGYHLVYTLRSDDLPNHRGQVSFPGGKRSPQDRNLKATALREATEETGIDASVVEVLGCLDDVYTMATDYVITPFVGLLPRKCRFKPNPSEVADLFTVSLDRLRDPRFQGTRNQSWKGTDYQLPAISAGPHTIWGATHNMTLNFLHCLEMALGDRA
ncbi:MAG: NUDIX hydrolase [Candidatus Binatia bacterium]